MDLCLSAATQMILDEINKNGSSRNVVMSPLSINVMLNMVASGSGGQTLEQFLKLLGSEGINDLNDKSSTAMSLLKASVASSSDQTEPELESLKLPMATYDRRLYRREAKPHEMYSSMDLPRKKKQGPLFSLVNALWVDHLFPLMPSFKDITESIYKAQVKSVDFNIQAEQVKEDVNLWVKNETKGLIKELLKPSVKLRPPLCLANALYFKGAWEQTFDASGTLDENFHLLNGETIKVPFMRCQKVYRSYASFDDFKVLKLPYQRSQSTNKQFSMYFFLPHRQSGLEDMVDKFNSDITTLQPKHFKLGEEQLSKVWIPKLKFSYSLDATELLKGKGLTLPFNPGKADFTNMVNSSLDNNVYIDYMHHKSCIEVNEEGTEAAATVFSMVVGCAPGYKPPPLPSFVADHPFMFMIVEEFSKLVIFTGAILNPTAGVNE